MAENAYVVVYWDASAILSVLLKDNHTEEARKWVKKRVFTSCQLLPTPRPVP